MFLGLERGLDGIPRDEGRPKSGSHARADAVRATLVDFMESAFHKSALYVSSILDYVRR